MSHFKDIFENAGYLLVDYGNFWRSSANYRSGTNKSSLVICKNNGYWVDFGSSEYESLTPPEELLKLTLHIDDKKAKEIVGNEESEEEIPKVNYKKLERGEKIVNPEYLETLLPHYDFYLNKGIGEEVLSFFKSGYCMTDEMYQRFVFPIENEFGMIHGLSGRDATNNKAIKWKHLGLKKKWIYPFFMSDENGYSPCREAIERLREVYLVESIGDMLKMWSMGFNNVLVIFGLSVSNSTINFLNRYPDIKIYICLNNDAHKGDGKNTGMFAAIKQFVILDSYFDEGKVLIKLPVKNDFGDMDNEDFKIWQNKETDAVKQKEFIKRKANEMSKNSSLPKYTIDKIRKW